MDGKYILIDRDFGEIFRDADNAEIAVAVMAAWQYVFEDQAPQIDVSKFPRAFAWVTSNLNIYECYRKNRGRKNG